MSDTKEQPHAQKRVFPAQVAEIIDEFTVVINRGSEDGVRNGQRLLIYAMGEMITDPETEEPLGHLEIVKGTGIVTHTQERMATVRSDRKKAVATRIIKPRSASWSWLSALALPEEETIIPPQEAAPLDGVARGDQVKPI